MESIIGMLGALIGVGLFVCGFFFGKNFDTSKVVERKDPDLTEEEQKEYIEARKRFIEDQKAFTTLINYNANQAYGMNNEPFTV